MSTRSDVFHAAAGILQRAVTIGDTWLGYARALSLVLEKKALQHGRSLKCPYCQEDIYAIDDHVAWCDVGSALLERLGKADTQWPSVLYGYTITQEEAVVLTRQRG